MCVHAVGVGWGDRMDMTIPYYSGVIRIALRTDSLLLIRHLAWLAPLEMRNITLACYTVDWCLTKHTVPSCR